jgi:hypothetical protein
MSGPSKARNSRNWQFLMNARDGLVRDRTTLKNHMKNLALPLLKHQTKARLQQIAGPIGAIDRQAQARVIIDAALLRKREIIVCAKRPGANLRCTADRYHARVGIAQPVGPARSISVASA